MSAFDLKEAADNEKVTWVDETKITAAERAWMQGCQALREAATELLEQSNSKLVEIRGGPDAGNFVAELSLLNRRKEWLAAILRPQPEQLSNLISQQKQQQAHASARDGCSGPASEVHTSTADLSAVSRAPPCSAWESLMTLTQLQALGDFHDCKGQADIKTKNEALKKQKAHLQNLMAAIRTALNDLATAKKRVETMRKKAEEKAKKSEEKRKKMDEDKPKKKRSKVAPSKHPLVDPTTPSMEVPQLTVRTRPLGLPRNC